MPADSKPTTVDVLLPLALPGPYSYDVPPGMALGEGDYVAVPLGPRQMLGVVWAMPGGDGGGARLRSVIGRIDTPPMPAAHRRFIDWIAAYYLEPPGNVLRLALRAPGALGQAPERIAYRPSGQLPAKMTPQRKRVMDAASEGLHFTQGELADLAGVGASVVKGLIREGALEAVALPADAPFRPPQVMAGRLALSKGQEKAAAQLRAMLSERGFHVALIDGVTGSGKTEVYFEAMAAALAAGRQVLLLLPEIALTASFLARVEERFAAAPAEWHSGMRPRERERVWRAVANAEARIVVGARSALFLPWKKLGLIVVDEEHDPAYKQGDGVPYHTRDMAVVYGSLNDFPIVLASATPSLESLYNVERGRYRAIHLPDRHGRAELPAVSLIDMRAAEVTPGRWLSEELASAVTATLERERTGAPLPQPPRLRPPHLVPGLRPPHGLPQLLGLAGRAPLPQHPAMPSLRPFRARARRLSRLRSKGQARPRGAGGRAAGGRSPRPLAGSPPCRPVLRPHPRQGPCHPDPRHRPSRL